MAMEHTSGNLTGLFIAEETILGQVADTPRWFEREPNSYTDFGGQFAMTTRKPIVHDRQHAKGETSDNSPTSGFEEDITLTNVPWLMQGFLYADARQAPTTRRIGAVGETIASVDADQYFVTGYPFTGWMVGYLVYAEGSDIAANNGLKRLSAVASGSVTVAGGGLTIDASPPAESALTVVGIQFGAGELTLTKTTTSVVLTTSMAGVDFTDDFDFTPGEWHFIGGDATGLRFADSGNNAPFYARLAAITATTLTYDKTTGVQVTNAGVGKTVQLFFGSVVRNEEDCTLIKARSYTQERQFGCGEGEIESEVIYGGSCNQMTITIPTPGPEAKVTMAFGFIATGSIERDATEGPLAETFVPALNEPCFKPGMDVYQHKLAVLDPATLNPTALVSYNSEATLVINNNLAGIKAIEHFGNAGVNVGELGVTGTLGSFWTSVQAARKVRQGADCTWHLILTKRNAAVIFDIASLGLGGGRTTVEANSPVKIPLETSAGKGPQGYTLCGTFMRYAPTVAMATA